MSEHRDYLSRAAEAALLGITPASVTRYRARHADYPLAIECPCCGSHVRDRVSVEAWQAARPGRGAGGGRPRRTPTKPEDGKP
jgi:hypothetical protein